MSLQSNDLKAISSTVRVTTSASNGSYVAVTIQGEKAMKLFVKGYSGEFPEKVSVGEAEEYLEADDLGV